MFTSQHRVTTIYMALSYFFARHHIYSSQVEGIQGIVPRAIPIESYFLQIQIFCPSIISWSSSSSCFLLISNTILIDQMNIELNRRSNLHVGLANGSLVLGSIPSKTSWRFESCFLQIQNIRSLIVSWSYWSSCCLSIINEILVEQMNVKLNWISNLHVAWPMEVPFWALF